MQNETITLDDLPSSLQQLQQRVRDEPAMPEPPVLPWRSFCRQAGSGNGQRSD